jgi:sugar lactone lactonase YvrE
MIKFNADLFCDVKCTLGEGPVWDEISNRLYWVDIVQMKIHQCTVLPKAILHQPIELDQPIGSFAFRKQGGMIAALKQGFAWVDPTSAQVTMITEIDKDKPNNRFNDGKCDPAGRFWAGTMSHDGKEASAGLYSIDRTQQVLKHLDEVSISNGICWNEKANTLYYIDTATMSVRAFDYDLDRGRIRNPRTVISVDPSEGFPDGMTIDQEGMLWIAHWEGWQVARWNPHTGKKIASISVPVSRVTSCVFGGEKMNQLYITTAHLIKDPTEIAQQPYAGSVFTIELDVMGTSLPRYAG